MSETNQDLIASVLRMDRQRSGEARDSSDVACRCMSKAIIQDRPQIANRRVVLTQPFAGFLD